MTHACFHVIISDTFLFQQKQNIASFFKNNFIYLPKIFTLVLRTYIYTCINVSRLVAFLYSFKDMLPRCVLIFHRGLLGLGDIFICVDTCNAYMSSLHTPLRL